MTSSIRIVLADDHHVVRQGLKLVLATEPDFELVAEAGDGLEAVRCVEQFRPEVLVLDLMLPRLHGLEVCRQVSKSWPKTRIVVLSSHADGPYVQEALRSGALGYVLKDSTSADLVAAIRSVTEEKRYLSQVLMEKVLQGYAEPSSRQADEYESLTPRERLVLQLAAEGCTSNEIAEKLFISPRTAETHRANLMRKLALASQTHLVRFAIRKGIISP